MSQPTSSSWRTGALVLGVLVLLSVVAVEPPDAQNRLTTTDGGVVAGGPVDGSGVPGAVQPGAVAASGGPSAGPGAGGSGQGNVPGSAVGGSTVRCAAGQNGGSTDRGVSAREIRVAATNVRSGSGASFLGSSYIGMQAAINRVNAKGGVCGRLVKLTLRDDGWNAARGATFLRNFTKEDYFALAVVPSSEGLTAAILNKTISDAGIPVVGTDGMLKEQYSNPWVWPVATATVSTMRIMAKHAIDKGAQTFGIVFDAQYKFGEEGAKAFRDYLESTGRTVQAYVPIQPGKPSYGSEAQKFSNDCGSTGCDFVAMLLDPNTANTYIASNGKTSDGKRKGFGRLLTGGAQPLFNDRFAIDCKAACSGMLVWTGYNPPIGRLGSLPGVTEYVNDVKSVSPGADVNNQFLEGAYLGMRVFLDALQRVGPTLTRNRLRDVMNSTTYRSDLSSPLSWTATQRFANTSAQAFTIVTASGNFVGFQEANTGFIKDPMPGKVPS